MDFKREIENIVLKAKKVILTPQDFFGKLREKGKKKALIYWISLATVNYLLSVFVLLLSKQIKFDAAIYVYMPLGITLLALLTFVMAGVLHLWIKLFGGKATYEKTYQLMVYSSTPSHLFGWIPIVGRFIFVWQLVLLGLGTMYFHKVSRQKAIIMYFLLFVLVFVIMILLSTLLVSFLGKTLADLA